MKTAIPPPPEGSASSSRRAQPPRQTRSNPPRTTALNRTNSLNGGIGREQPIDIFPAVTYFTDAITALPKELVRHFTLLKEVDAKIFAPEEALLQLVQAALTAEPTDLTQARSDGVSNAVPGSAAMSAQNSSSGTAHNGQLLASVASSVDETPHVGVFDPSNYPRRQLFRDTALKIQEMLVSLEEKNHVISTANDALQKELGRIEHVWPALQAEFSEEAKWGSSTHWAYAENRIAKANNTQAERSRREGAATLSAAAQQLAEEAAARSSDRKQALAAKKNAKNQANQAAAAEGEADRQNESVKKSQGSKSRKQPGDTATPVGLGISTATATVSNNPAPKRRKVEAAKNNGGTPMERAMSSVFGNNAAKTKTTSPRETPAPEGTGATKKRKALPTSSNHAKKSRTGAGSVASSPVVSSFPDNIRIGRSSPAPSSAPRPVSSRARQNSLQNPVEVVRQRPPSAASIKPNGAPLPVPEISAPINGGRAIPPEPKVSAKEVPAPSKPEAIKPEVEVSHPPPPAEPTSNGNKKEKELPAKAVEEPEPRKESTTPIPPPVVVTTTTVMTTKSGRASKPSTPALASTFVEASQPRSRPSRNGEGVVAAKRSHKKGASSISAAAVVLAAKQAAEEAQSSAQEDEDDGDEPRYCYCNNVSYGEMVACDGDGCPREWFHLGCVGLKVAPKGNAKWYCEDCKKRLKAGDRKINGR